MIESMKPGHRLRTAGPVLCLMLIFTACSVILPQQAPPAAQTSPMPLHTATLRVLFPTRTPTPLPGETAQATQTVTEAATSTPSPIPTHVPTAVPTHTNAPPASPTPVQGAGSAAYWAIAYGTQQDERAGQVFEISGGGLLLTGQTGANTHWVKRLDTSGAILWQKSFIYPVGTIFESRSGDFVLFSTQAITRIRPDGSVIWAKVYNTSMPLAGNGLALDQVIVINEAENGSITLESGQTKAVLQVDGQLDITAHFPPRPDQNPNDYVYESAANRPGTHYLLGTHPIEGGDFFVSRTTETESWKHTFNLQQDGGPHIWPPAFILPLSDGDILAGVTVRHLTGDASMDIWLVRLSSEGSVRWQRVIGPQATFNELIAIETGSGDLLLAGIHYRFGVEPSPAATLWLIRLGQDGKVRWDQSYLAPEETEIYGLKELSDGSIVVTGRTNAFGAGSYDAWVMKLNAQGEIPGCILSSGRGQARTVLPNPKNKLQPSEARYSPLDIAAAMNDSPGAGMVNPNDGLMVICSAP